MFAPLLVSIFAVFCSAQLTSHTSFDISKKSLETLLSPSTLRDTYYAAKLLKTIKISNFKCDCNRISSLLDQSTDGFSVYYGLQSAKDCGCSNVAVSNSLKQSLAAGVESQDFLSFAGSVLALGSIENSSPDFGIVLEKLKLFVQPNGIFKSSLESDSPSSIENTKVAFQLLEEYSQYKKSLFEFAENFLFLLPQGDDEIEVDPTLLSSIMKISEKKPRLSASRLTVISESLLALAASGDVVTASKAFAALDAVASYKIAPVYISLDTTIISDAATAAEKKLSVSVLDAFGKPVEYDSIIVKSIKYSGKELTATKDTVAEAGIVDLSNLPIVAGRYSIELGVALPGRNNVISDKKKYFVVSSSVEVSDVLAGVTETKQSSTFDLQAITVQNRMQDLSASGLDADVFHVAFSLSSSSRPLTKPHQVFVKFSHVTSGTSTFFVAKNIRQGDSNSKLNYRVAVTLHDEVETFLHLSGEYVVSLLVGDAILTEPVEWVLGSITIKFPVKQVQEFPLYSRSLLHDSDNTLTALPEISHVMRVPDKRASVTMSTGFSGIVLLPLLGLVAYMLSLKPNLKRLQSASGLLFIVTLATVLALYLGYWFALPRCSFYETLNYLCFLLPFTLVVGRSALTAVTETRKQEGISSAKKQ